VTVTPPAIITAGTIGNVVVTVTSSAAPNPTAQVTDVTTIAAIDAATLTPANQTVSGLAGNTVSFFPTLRNTGSTTISYTLSLVSAAWPADVQPQTTLTLAPGVTLPLSITVQIPADAPDNTDNLTTLTVRRGGAPDILATGLYTATTRLIGTLLIPPLNEQTIFPGTTGVFTHTITNITGAADTFTFRTIATNGWIVDVAPASVFLEAGESRDISVFVTVPNGSPAASEDYSYVEAQSVAIASLNALGTEITTVAQQAGVVISPDRGADVTPGQTIEFQHTLVNQGNGLDTFTISLSTNLGWPVTLTVPPTGEIALLPGASFPVEVRLQVPADAPQGALEQVRVLVTSQTNTLVQSEVVNRALYPKPFIPPPPPVYRVALPLVRK
jgi:uncharacterized membrane protein